MWRVLLALLIVVIAVSTTFNAITVAMPKLFAERLAGVTQSPALLGVIAAGVYVFGAMTQYTIGRLIDHYSLKTVMLPLSFMLAPFIYFAATLSNLPLIIASIYHPVGTAMIVSYADKLGREMGLNGVWGNLGVASSALVTGVIGQYLGWRWAFIVPGVVTILIGVAFALMVVHEDRTGTK